MLNLIIHFFDKIHFLWEKHSTERGLGLILLWIYIITLGAVELKRMGYYPGWLPSPPDSHFFSIQLAFTLILGLEVVSLIFVLPSSLSRSIGKQLEILTLILLRNAFKELALLPEPVYVDIANIPSVIDIAVCGAGAFFVFLCLGFYRRITRKQNLLSNKDLLNKYVISKKLVAFCLLIIFLATGCRSIWLFMQGIDTDFFETIYTVLIFADIAMVLVAQRYMPNYYAVFRNSGFVIGTLMMRLSLSAPPLLCSAIAVFGALYVLALTWGTNLFAPDSDPIS